MNLINPKKGVQYKLTDATIITYNGTRIMDVNGKKKSQAIVILADGSEKTMSMYDLKKDIVGAVESTAVKPATPTPAAENKPEEKPKSTTEAQPKPNAEKPKAAKPDEPTKSPEKPARDSFAKEMADGFFFWFPFLRKKSPAKPNE